MEKFMTLAKIRKIENRVKKWRLSSHRYIIQTGHSNKYYNIKLFFSGIRACVNGVDALTNWINVQRIIGTVYTCTNSWKEPFNTYNSLMQYWT